jgi:hypothetical protein
MAPSLCQYQHKRSCHRFLTADEWAKERKQAQMQAAGRA